MNKLQTIIAPFYDGLEGIEIKKKDTLADLNSDYIILHATKSEELENEKLLNASSILDINTKIALISNYIISNKSFPLLIGGDHSLSIGLVSGVASYLREVGILFIDANPLMYTTSTSPNGAVAHMVAAVLQGLGDKRLVNIFSAHKKVKTSCVFILGLRQVSKEEQDLMNDVGVHYINYARVKEIGIVEALKEVEKQLKNRISYLHISLNLSALDQGVCPGQINRIPGGMNLEELNLIIDSCFDSFTVSSMDIVGYNKDNDKKEITRNIIKDLVTKVKSKLD